MKLNITEMGTWQQKVQVDSDYQMAMLSGSQGPDASAISMRVHSAGAFNLAHCKNAELRRSPLPSAIRFMDIHILKKVSTRLLPMNSPVSGSKNKQKYSGKRVCCADSFSLAERVF